MAPVRVLLADDHPVIIEGLRAALVRHDVEVVGQVECAQQVVSAYLEAKPDVLVLDVRFGPGPTGLDVARSLRERAPAARIVFYSQFDQDEVIREAYRLGAAAFITKNTLPAELASAIHAAANGKTYFLPAIAERLALLGLRGEESPRARLEARELDIFVQLATGATNNEIAERMGLSTKTISTIAQAVKEKLGVHRPAEITRLAMRYGLIEP
ncbi:response regulator [Rubrivivax gelatinosus]|uniref:LuxR family two component transcriptional regulator n=1 Tax=Rubrivivax gelatinosus TaxID=28068 RepID=A0A4R2MFA1_RUBGE|nr:response regulator transcription factor [Rubrivivax gelatinosus]MBK1687809.1 DNA-binding response regulator [Rubrivivax gelatinosus]TCP03427.1 LuxR family two component transcriptional regulator [Rubrivivax gelatinosus]